MEEKERLLTVDEDIPDEEEEGTVKDEETDLKNPASGATGFRPWERKLTCVDETSKVFMLLCYNDRTSSIIMW